MFTSDVIIWVFVLWLTLVGGAVGSFMNVVVYRLPLGLSLVYPPSHCPACKHRIRWYDNVPVIGWMMLGGKCRHCRGPISFRYPLVEALTAGMFGILAAVEPDKLQSVYGCHVLLLCTLFCAGLMVHDGNRPPIMLFVPTWVLGIVAPMIWPDLRLMGWGSESVGTANAIDCFSAISVGGYVFWWFLSAKSKSGLAPCLLCVAQYLGWPTFWAIAGVTIVIHGILWPVRTQFPKLGIPLIVLFTAMTFGAIIIAARLAT